MLYNMFNMTADAVPRLPPGQSISPGSSSGLQQLQVVTERVPGPVECEGLVETVSTGMMFVTLHNL